MSKFLPTLIAAAFAVATTGALAADSDAKSARKQVRDEYKADVAKCKDMKGKEEKSCKEEAKSKRDAALAQIKDEKKAAKGKSPSSGSSSTSSTTSEPSTPSSTTAPSSSK